MTKPLACIFFALVLSNSCAIAAGVAVVDINEQVDGKSLDEYASVWWQWASSMPDAESPVMDLTGAKCHVNQNGAVWFLAGGYGSSRIHRECTVPRDRYIFFPVINMVTYTRPGTVGARCEDRKEDAALNNDELRSFVVTIDELRLVNPARHRYSSPTCFDLNALVPKKYKAPNFYPSAADGYRVMLKPLSPGEHRIAFHAEYGNDGSRFGRMVQDIEYTLRVVEP
jgi:hypothetical protein